MKISETINEMDSQFTQEPGKDKDLALLVDDNIIQNKNRLVKDNSVWNRKHREISVKKTDEVFGSKPDFKRMPSISNAHQAVDGE